jgi:hypothetical protein
MFSYEGGVSIGFGDGRASSNAAKTYRVYSA